jgi:Fe-S cluster assembly protein SufD
MEALAQTNVFLPNFGAVEGKRSAEPSWLAGRRRAAIERFQELDFPTAKSEEWHYTSVGPIVATPWVLSRAERGQPMLQTPTLPAGVRVARLKDVLSIDPERLRPYLSNVAGFQKSAFTALNTAFFEDGLLVEIARGAVVETPIEIQFDSSGVDGPFVSHPRCLVVAAEGSQATVVERYAGQGAYFQNSVTEIVLESGAGLSHIKLQQEDTAASHVQTIAVTQGRVSRFTSHNIALGAALARTDLTVELASEGAECRLDGIFLGSGAQHLDNHTTIDHAMPHGTSRELYKGILDGRARGVFHGKIIVRPDAQKTDAMQTNKNLLLSREALVNSTPALEIFADDVKCKHGSTIGQLDANALFYLRSRGIGEEQARALLTWAFASDVAQRIPVASVRAELQRALGQRLLGGGQEAIR